VSQDSQRHSRRASATCPRCHRTVQQPSAWSSAWRCDWHGEVYPLFPAFSPSREGLDGLLQQFRPGTAGVPVWLPWPLPAGWLVTGFAGAGDERTGVCVMRLTAGLDSGPVALQAEVPLNPEENFESLSARLADLGAELLLSALEMQEEEKLEFTEQDEDGVTYAEKVDPDERHLDPDRPAVELAAKVRALNPHVGTYLETAGGERLGVRRAHAVEAEVPRGTLEGRLDTLLLGCGEGVLQLDVVQPPGGKAMPADAYLRGHEPPRL